MFQVYFKARHHLVYTVNILRLYASVTENEIYPQIL